MPEVIILGATGFIGRNLVEYLRRLDYSVTVVTRYGSGLGGFTGISFSEFDSYEVDPTAIVVNLAACRYNSSNLSNSGIFTGNMSIIDRVYSFCVRNWIKEVRQFSSISVYPATEIDFDDSKPLDFNSPPHRGELMYAWAKRVGEVYADLYKQEYGINTITFRPTSPYGPHDSLDRDKAHVVPALIMKMLTGNGSFEVRGNAQATRDFIYVEDVCGVVEASLSFSGKHEAYNLGSGVNTPIRNLAYTISEQVWPQAVPFFPGGAYNPVASRCCNNTKLVRDFGLARFTSLSDGIAQTVQWYKAALA